MANQPRNDQDFRKQQTPPKTGQDEQKFGQDQNRDQKTQNRDPMNRDTMNPQRGQSGQQKKDDRH